MSSPSRPSSNHKCSERPVGKGAEKTPGDDGAETMTPVQRRRGEHTRQRRDPDDDRGLHTPAKTNRNKHQPQQRRRPGSPHSKKLAPLQLEDPCESARRSRQSPALHHFGKTQSQLGPWHRKLLRQGRNRGKMNPASAAENAVPPSHQIATRQTRV